MRAMLISGLGGLMLAACHGATCVESDPQALQVETQEISAFGARSVALDAVYERHPTRALVDFANVEQTGTSPAVYQVHVEMTGSPEARAIYEVEVSETSDGKLDVTGFTKSQ